jgi:hypothetical protein
MLIWVKQAGYTVALYGEEVCGFYVDIKGPQVHHLRQAC